MSLSISPYGYHYGWSAKKNRQIEFVRPDNDPTKIYAKISALKEDGSWICISNLQGDEISVQMESTTNKIKKLWEENVVEPIPNSNLNELSLDEQDAILGSLEPTGYRRIGIDNYWKDAPMIFSQPFEIPVKLLIFDPS